MEKYLYIKLDIRGYYVDFGEKFKPELYNNLGETYEDFLDNKWVLLSEEQKAFHIENPNASVKEVWDMSFTPEPERTVEVAKHEMLMKIDSYDRSSKVNGFTVNEKVEGWFTPEERSNYKSSIDAAKLLGIETLSFFIGDLMISVTPESAEQMLAMIQLYADQCFIVTKQHKIAVEALETVEDIDAFDYENGYPQKLNFTVEQEATTTEE